MVWPTMEMAQTHYKDLSKKPFFPSLCKFFSSGPIICMCWEGKDIIKQGRQMLGETQPLASKPGSIRGDYSIDLGRYVSVWFLCSFPQHSETLGQNKHCPNLCPISGTFVTAAIRPKQRLMSWKCGSQKEWMTGARLLILGCTRVEHFQDLIGTLRLFDLFQFKRLSCNSIRGWIIDRILPS